MKRKAFTLVELLVVIAIIGILVSLLLACRASGSRSSSAHAMHQQPQATRPRNSQLPFSPRDCHCA